MDWDKLRTFHAVARAGSFTHAGEKMHLSQSAVSRQVSALEHDLGVSLFHRHARGLVLTEQGEALFRTAHDVLMKLEAIQVRLKDSKEKPSGPLTVTATVGLGSTWLAARIHRFTKLYPDIELCLLLDDQDLDLNLREADVALRLHQPTQLDFIQRKLFTVHFHLFAAASYLEKNGYPQTLEELDQHRIVVFGTPIPDHLRDVNWLLKAGRPDGKPRRPALSVNNVVALKRVVEEGAGIAMLPDYIIDENTTLIKLLADAQIPSIDTYFTYPERMRHSKRVKVFRDFLVDQAQRWAF